MEWQSCNKSWVNTGGVWSPIYCDKANTASQCPGTSSPWPSVPGAAGNSTRQSHHKPEMWPLFPVGILAISDFIWIVNIPHIYLFVYVCVHGFEQAFWNFTYLLPGYNILHLLKPLFKGLIHTNQKHTHKPGSWQSCFRGSSLWSVLGKSYIINSSLSISLIVFGRLSAPRRLPRLTHSCVFVHYALSKVFGASKGWKNVQQIRNKQNQPTSTSID